MSQLAILIPDPADVSCTDIWQPVLARLRAALATAGLMATRRMPWDSIPKGKEQL